MALNRRTFLKSIGVAASAPVLAKSALASDVFITEKASNTYKIVTANIRVALPEDDAAGFGWNSRKEICADILRKQKADVICLQEVLREQNEDLKKALPGYFSFGFEGPEMDEFNEGYHLIAKNPIFFSTKRFELLAAGGYWLSETPLVAGSKSWDTARARNANWIRIRDKKSGRQIRVSNLHLDHVNQTAREKQIKLVLDDAAQYQPDLPQILTGDFNASATNTVYKMVKAAGWKDTYTDAHGEAEPGFTVHEFQGENYTKKDKGKKIDFIFYKGNFKTTSASIIKDSVNGRYPSDHYFVSAEVSF
ncbi:MAG: Endonuclease/exonuclease/phosphatase [Sphingobacteriaceae bacterium]|jgi:endonuclease/exonuclease/phosphatase family metal-dependent hydrolase|nr:Endonuclease/exonuclease/phosphatase [Sphingobacteriaceae bacterium]